MVNVRDPCFLLGQLQSSNSDFDAQRYQFGGVPGASMDRLSSAPDAYLRRRRGRAGEPGTLPAREFDPDFRNDDCSSGARRRGYIRQSLAYRWSFQRPRWRKRWARSRFWLSSIVWKGRSRYAPSIGGSAEVAGLWRLDVRDKCVYPALASADQFVIGSVMGVASVAHYAVPMGLTQRSVAIPVALGRTLFPRMSSLPGDAAHALGARALSTMAYGFGAICAPAIILSPIFFRYWIGGDFAIIAGPVAQLLFPGIWMGSLSLVGFHSPAKPRQGRRDRQTEHH